MSNLTTIAISKEVSSLIRIEASLNRMTMQNFVEGLVMKHIDVKYPDEE